jgi:chemotaxis protein MotA
MSLSSLLGALFGFGLFLASIFTITSNYLSFLDFHGAMIVFGGTIASAYMSFQARYVNIAFKAMWWMIKKPRSTREGLSTEIARLIKWAYIVQSKGLQGLENEIKSVHPSEPLLKYCLELVTTNYKPEELRAMLETAVEAQFERNVAPVAVLKMMAGAAPAFGMIGTLVGMVVMMQGLGNDIASMGMGLATALLATLYAVVYARLLCMPAAEKLQQKEEIERFRNYLITEGLVMLAEKHSPRFMQDRLNSFLDPDTHFNLDRQGGR